MMDVFAYAGPPARWIARDGLPAPCLGDVRKGGGMPSFVQDEEFGKLAVFDLLVAQRADRGGLMLWPRWYGSMTLRACDGLVPLHDSPEAKWEYRPMVYNRAMFSWQALGSQRELAWRYGLHLVMLRQAQDVAAALGMDMEGGRADDRVVEGWGYGGSFELEARTEDRIEQRYAEWMEADEKAEATLIEHLNPVQRIEFGTTNSFRCRGAATGNLYRLDVGNGFEILSKSTGEPIASYCWHPDEWIPECDVALATKLALEDEELEVETLENARVTFLDREEVSPLDRHAAKLELELTR